MLRVDLLGGHIRPGLHCFTLLGQEVGPAILLLHAFGGENVNEGLENVLPDKPVEPPGALPILHHGPGGGRFDNVIPERFHPRLKFGQKGHVVFGHVGLGRVGEKVRGGRGVGQGNAA